MMKEFVYVFMCERAFVPAGIFTSYEKAEKWIIQNKLSGCLTKLPVNISLYDWAIEKEYFEVKNENQNSPKFKAQFSCAATDHWHFENGE